MAIQCFRSKLWYSVVFVASTLALCSLSSRADPVITSISPISSAASQTITITGSGFGTMAPYTGDSEYILMFDETGGDWSAGYASSTYFMGVCCDAVTMVVESWTDTSIVLGGFAGGFDTNGWDLNVGDQLEFYLWNAQTDAGPAMFGAVVTPEPASWTLIGVGLLLFGLLRLKKRARSVAYA